VYVIYRQLITRTLVRTKLWWHPVA